MGKNTLDIADIFVDPATPHTFNIPDFLVPSSAKERREETLALWSEVHPTLPDAVRVLAQHFVNLCKSKGAFYCDPGCHIDLIDDDQVMFDWNNGEPPIFTVLIGSDPPPITFVGKFKEGKITSETIDFELLEAPLDRLIKEIGNPLWAATSSPDLLILAGTADLALDEQPFTRLRLTEDSPSSPQRMRQNRTFWKQGAMLPEKETRAISWGGHVWPGILTQHSSSK